MSISSRLGGGGGGAMRNVPRPLLQVKDIYYQYNFCA